MTIFHRNPMGQKEPKPKPNPKRMAAVKMLPCIVCGHPPPSDVHHCISGRYSQARADDEKTIPLCKPHHQWGPDAIHNGKESWEKKYGKDYDYLPKVNAMLRRAEDDALGEWF